MFQAYIVCVFEYRSSMNKNIGYVSFLGYISTIFLANWAIARFGFVSVGFGLLAPAGVYFVGLAFTLRDTTQRFLGNKMAIIAIVIGAGLSYFVSPDFALASGVAFLVSEFADYAIYTPLSKKNWLASVALSNTVGTIVDSALFLYLAFGSLDFITGQIVGKLWMTVLAIIVLIPVRNKIINKD